MTVVEGDAFALADIEGAFDGGLAMQWWSHVPYARRGEFLARWHGRLAPGSAVFLGDNQLTPPWDACLVRRPGEADTYEPRTLPDGSSYVIVKNYFTAAELQATFASHAAGDVQVTMGTRWWWLSYRLP